jgi:hypothetical protein
MTTVRACCPAAELCPPTNTKRSPSGWTSQFVEEGLAECVPIVWKRWPNSPILNSSPSRCSAVAGAPPPSTPFCGAPYRETTARRLGRHHRSQPRKRSTHRWARWWGRIRGSCSQARAAPLGHGQSASPRSWLHPVCCSRLSSGPAHVAPLGTDTLLVQDGKVVMQSFTAVVRRRRATELRRLCPF